jgi:Flp pilus assembly protein TadD
VVQSSAEFYRLYGVRIAANTGLPTIVSPLHEAEQRNPELVWARDRAVQQLYRTVATDEAVRIIAEYHVGYIYAGPIERIVYGDGATATFTSLLNAGLLSLAYQNEAVTIYRVEPAAYQQARSGASPAQPAGDAAADTSLRELEAHHAANPSDLGVAWELALRYADAGRYADAARILERHAAERPDDVGLQQLYGDLLSRAGQYDLAEQAFRRAIAVAPTAANYTRLGAEQVVWGRLAAAEETLALARDSDPQLPDPYFYLGQIAEERGERERAIELYRQCLMLAGAGDPIRSNVEEALARLGAE